MRQEKVVLLEATASIDQGCQPGALLISEGGIFYTQTLSRMFLFKPKQVLELLDEGIVQAAHPAKNTLEAAGAASAFFNF